MEGGWAQVKSALATGRHHELGGVSDRALGRTKEKEEHLMGQERGTKKNIEVW